MEMHSTIHRGMRFVRKTGILLVPLLLAACTGTALPKPVQVEDGRFIEKILDLRGRLASDPQDASLRSQLLKLERRAVEYYHKTGMTDLKNGDPRSAVIEFRKGLLAQPGNGELATALQRALRRQEAAALVEEARRNLEAGKQEAAERLVANALDLAPDSDPARQLAAHLAGSRQDQVAEQGRESGLALDSSEPIDLSFRDTNLKRAFEFLAGSFSINVLFDPEVGDESVTLFARNLQFSHALDLLLTATDTFYKRISDNTILIAPDNEEKRGQYEDYRIQSFQMRAVEAKQMVTLLQNVLALDNVTVNEEDNSLIVRDSERRMELVRRIVTANDRKPAEVLLEVEIIEVNHTRAEQLGFDFGSRISASFEEFPIDSSWGDALQNGTVTLPGIAFRYFKQDVEAEILANPQIRVLDNKAAKIHIGDSVPLRSSTILDATGQTRTTFEYRDVGVRLAVQPKIHLDNSVTVKMSLEVSSLGQNLGTPEEPAFSIGTRNAETHMLLRDGETVILGGLVRNEERQNRVMVPGLGEIPVVGTVFRSSDDETARTDVLLAMTPRVVRPKEIPPRELRTMYSGTKDFFSARPSYSAFDNVGEQARFRLGGTSLPDAAPATTEAGDSQSIVDRRPTNGRSLADNSILRFAQRTYAVSPNEEITVAVLGDRPRTGALEATIVYDPALLEITEVVPADENLTTRLLEPGRLRMRATPGVTPEGPLARLHLKGRSPGISYLMIDLGDREAQEQADEGVDTGERPRVQASRVVVE